MRDALDTNKLRNEYYEEMHALITRELCRGSGVFYCSLCHCIYVGNVKILNKNHEVHKFDTKQMNKSLRGNKQYGKMKKHQKASHIAIKILNIINSETKGANNGDLLGINERHQNIEGNLEPKEDHPIKKLKTIEKHIPVLRKSKHINALTST